MTREIKFRAWLGGQDRYVGVDAIDFDEDSIRINDEYFFLADLEQYTGLTDKNGKEIYEGDVIKYESLYGDIGTKKVSFEDGMFCVSHLALAQLGSIEILGNIHENPELI